MTGGAGPARHPEPPELLPEQHTDLIFSVLCEEFGFVGAAALMALYRDFCCAAWRSPHGPAIASARSLLG